MLAKMRNWGGDWAYTIWVLVELGNVLKQILSEKWTKDERCLNRAILDYMDELLRRLRNCLARGRQKQGVADHTPAPDATSRCPITMRHACISFSPGYISVCKRANLERIFFIFSIHLARCPEKDAAIQYIVCRGGNQSLHHTRCCCVVGASRGSWANYRAILQPSYHRVFRSNDWMWCNTNHLPRC